MPWKCTMYTAFCMTKRIPITILVFNFAHEIILVVRNYALYSFFSLKRNLLNNVRSQSHKLSIIKQSNINYTRCFLVAHRRPIVAPLRFYEDGCLRTIELLRNRAHRNVSWNLLSSRQMEETWGYVCKLALLCQVLRSLILILYCFSGFSIEFNKLTCTIFVFHNINAYQPILEVCIMFGVIIWVCIGVWKLQQNVFCRIIIVLFKDYAIMFKSYRMICIISLALVSYLLSNSI